MSQDERGHSSERPRTKALAGAQCGAGWPVPGAGSGRTSSPVARVQVPHFRVRHRRAVLYALELYATTNLDFGDVFIIASME